MNPEELPDTSESQDGGKRRRRRRTRSRKGKRGGSFLNRLLVPGALLVGQKTLQSRKRHGKETRRRHTRRGRK